MQLNICIWTRDSITPISNNRLWDTGVMARLGVGTLEQPTDMYHLLNNALFAKTTAICTCFQSGFARIERVANRKTFPSTSKTMDLTNRQCPADLVHLQLQVLRNHLSIWESSIHDPQANCHVPAESRYYIYLYTKRWSIVETISSWEIFLTI